MKQTANSIVLHRLVALLLTAALWLGLSIPSRAGDVSLVVLSKGQSYLQTNATATTLNTNYFPPFNIYAFVKGTGAISAVTAFNVTAPGEAVEFTGDGGEFYYQKYATNNAELEEFLPPGRYTINIATAQDSNYTATVTLPSAAYPNIPKILNWDAAQNIDPFADYTLSWTPMTGGTAQDFIILNIHEESLNELDGEPELYSYSSPFLGEPGQLNGLSNSIVIPAGSLKPGRAYYVNLTFVNFTTYTSNLIAGAAVGVGFVRETEIELATETIPAQGRIQFASTNLTVNEADGTVAISLDRVGSAEGDVIVTLASVNLTATAGADYTSITQRVAFPNGISNVTITLSITDDSFLEGPERFRLGLINSEDGAALTRHTNAIVTITDSETNSAGKVSFSAATYQVIEASTNVNVIVRREGGTTGDVGGTIRIIGGTADDEDDYETSSGETMSFTIPAGKTSATNVITIFNDDEAEGNETVIMRLESLSGGAFFGKIGTNTLTILDDESSFAFEVARTTNVENNAEVKITVLRSGSSLEPASVDFAAYGEEVGFAPAMDAPRATSGVDFLGTTGTLTFPKGVAKKNFTVKILDDLTLETTEVIRLALRNPTNAQLGELDEASLYIKENDLAGTVSFMLTNQNVKEAVGGAKIIVIRTGGLASNIMVRLATQDGSATDAADYLGFSSNLVFRGREVKKTIPLSVIQDALVETTENLTLALTSGEIDAASDFTPASQPGQYAGLGTKTRLTVSIADDDKGGKIGFDKPAYSVNEGAGTLAIILKRTDGSASNVTVRLQSGPGLANPATDGDDYIGIDTVITFGPGETRKTNTLIILNDSIADALLPETIALTLREYTGGAKPGGSNSVVALIDDEASVSFASATSSGVENKTVTITVARGGFLGSTSTVEYMFMDGTATNGLDYTGVAGTLTFKPKEVLKTITVPIATDPNVESTAENFTVILKNATNALLGAFTTNTVSITDAPAVGAIDPSKTPFIKYTVSGVEGYSLNRSVSITGQGVDTDVSGTTVTIKTYTPTVGGNNVSITGSLNKGSGSFVQDLAGTLLWSPQTPGIYTNPSDIPFFYTYTNTGNPNSGFLGSGVESGTFTVDVVERDGGGTVTTVAGRMNVIINGTVNGVPKKVRLVCSFLAKP